MYLIIRGMNVTETINSKLNFTKNAIEQLPIPNTKGRIFYSDTRQPGLQLMVTNKGAKSFKVTRKHQGRLIRVTLGRYPDMTIELARKKACEVLATIANGVNPNEEKRKIRDEITFGEMVHDYIHKYGKQHTKSWEDTERTLKRLAGSLYPRRASSITNRELLALHIKIGQNCGEYQANRVIEKIRSVFNKMMEWGWEGKNPVRGIKKYDERARDRFLLPDEMPRFMQALMADENEIARDYILMSLFTGARRTNVLSMRWEQIDFHNSIWRIPKTKNGDSQMVVLVLPALELLKKRFDESDKQNPWVFPGSGKKGHFSDPKKTWRRILKRAELTNLRIHDLRRTLGSWQAAMGASSFIIGKTLGHKSSEATAIYARLNLDPVRESVTLATQAMINASEINRTPSLSCNVAS